MIDPSSPIKSLATVGDIATRLVNTIKEAEAKKVAIELQGVILSLQNDIFLMHSEQSNLLQIKNDLEKKLMEYENWDEIKSQYELKELVPGSFVYVPKPDSNLSEPDHSLCTQCFNDGNKSILQRKRSNSLLCPKCKTEIYTTPPKYRSGHRTLTRV